MTTPTFRIGGLVNRLVQYLADVNTIPINLAGVPSVSVPCGSTRGLPSVVGFFDEPKILGGGGCGVIEFQIRGGSQSSITGFVCGFFKW